MEYRRYSLASAPISARKSRPAARVRSRYLPDREDARSGHMRSCGIHLDHNARCLDEEALTIVATLYEHSAEVVSVR